MKLLKLLPLFIILIQQSADSRVINVPAQYASIQAGVNASSLGDTILVQPGIYRECIEMHGHNPILASLYYTTGDTSYISTTIIDADSAGIAILCGGGEGHNTLITGFSITKGLSTTGAGIYCYNADPRIFTNRIYNCYGVGIWCDNSANPTIWNNTISNNFGSGIVCWQNAHPDINQNNISNNQSEKGGGILVRNSGVFTIRNNVISGNEVWANYWGQGGGIYCINSSPIIDGNILTGNTALSPTEQTRGGGIYLYASNAVISNNLIENNIAGEDYGFGGGIYIEECPSPIIRGNRILGNRAGVEGVIGGDGGAIYVFDQSNPLIESNIITGNVASRDGGGIYCYSISAPVIRGNVLYGNSSNSGGAGSFSGVNLRCYNNIIWANMAQNSQQLFIFGGNSEVTYNDIEGGWDGLGNIDVIPAFRNPGDGDFHLMAVQCGDNQNSPCIDTGNPFYVDSLLDCSWGLGLSACDMGAYGGGDTLRDGIDNLPDMQPVKFILFKNYPNPFNPSTTIKYYLPNSGNTHITIYNITGQKIATLVDKNEIAGEHSILWNSTGLSSGLYFARMESSGQSQTIKLMLLR
jgi:parallel beta-helix repeat protein